MKKLRIKEVKIEIEDYKDMEALERKEPFATQTQIIKGEDYVRSSENRVTRNSEVDSRSRSSI